ncbi:hypothetical protein [Streptomyces tauricus]
MFGMSMGELLSEAADEPSGGVTNGSDGGLDGSPDVLVPWPGDADGVGDGPAWEESLEQAVAGSSRTNRTAIRAARTGPRRSAAFMGPPARQAGMGSA